MVTELEDGEQECPFCGGLGEVEVRPTKSLIFGATTPFSKRCQVCGGHGYVRPCPRCEGTGSESYDDFECLTCEGAGFVES